jgi:LacI family transcriptional regulator
LPSEKKDPFWVPCNLGIQEFEKEYQNFGIKVEKYFFDSEDTASFTKIGVEVIESLPDAILMVPLFQKEAILIVESCHEKGIKTSIFNNFIETKFTTNFIGQDLFQSGRVAAKLFDMLLNNGHIAIVHIDEDFYNATHLQEKEKGFRSYFEGEDMNRYKISTLNLNHKEANCYENFEDSICDFLDSNRDLNGLFITISKAYAIVDALKERLNNIVVVGYDLVHKNIKYLKNGNIDFLIHQKPKQQVYIGLTHLAEYFLFDKEIPEQLLLPIDIINSENIDGYLQ